MGILSTFWLCTICMQCLWSSEEGTGSPGTGVRNVCEVLGIETECFPRAANARNCWATTPAPCTNYLKYFLFLSMCTYVSVSGCVCGHSSPGRPECGVSCKAGVTGSCELPKGKARNPMLVLKDQYTFLTTESSLQPPGAWSLRPHTFISDLFASLEDKWVSCKQTHSGLFFFFFSLLSHFLPFGWRL